MNLLIDFAFATFIVLMIGFLIWFEWRAVTHNQRVIRRATGVKR